MRNKKSTPTLRQATPSTPAANDPFFIRPAPDASSLTSHAPFNAAAFDRYMMGGAETGHAGGDASGARKEGQSGGGGLGKKLLSFPWTRSDKKHATQQLPHPPPSPTISSPITSTLQTTASLPLGFPCPPPPAAVNPLPPSTSNKLQQHPGAAAIGAQSRDHPSNSSLSTFRTTSSFASTALFASSTDGWESEPTSASLTSSPESGRDSCGEAMPHRMWRVKGMAEQQQPWHHDPLDVVREEDETRSARHSFDGGRRNSTPVPRMVAAMLADPETPPRPKRFSTSSKPSPTSPPFDPIYEKAAARIRRAEEEVNAALASSPESSGDADDEVSPPRGKGRMVMRRDRSQDDLLMGSSLSSRTRIPSIRFEGLSMDAVFAEVEKKINGEANIAEDSSTTELDKKAKRRSRVLSMYKPLTYGEDFTKEDGEPLPPSPSPSTSTTTMDSLRSQSVTPTSAIGPLDVARPRPYPRRTSSRPTPLNVAAANSMLIAGPASAPVFGTSSSSSSISSSTPSGAFSPIPNRAPPMQIASPPLAGSFSPKFGNGPLSPKLGSDPLSPTLPSSPGLAEAFNPSPALSTTSTFRPFDIPEVCVFPPSPEQREREAAMVVVREAPIRRRSEPSQPIISGPTKVTMVQEKKVVRVSTRAPSKRSERQRMYTPPSALVSSVPHLPQLELRPSSSIETPPASPTFDSPTIPPLATFNAVPYAVPSVARTDFHPALSNLSVEQPVEDDSSDCEESLHNMLMRLNRPHTPPTSSSVETSAAPSLSLTELALELHMEGQSRISMLTREMSNNVSSSPSSTSSSKENVSPLSVRRLHRKSRVYESDDSATRFGDAPLTITVPKPLSPSVTHQPILESLRGELHSGSEEEEEYEQLQSKRNRSPVDLEKEIDDTLASIVGSASASTFSSSSSAASTPTHAHAHGHSDSMTSFETSSSLSFQDEASPTGASPPRPKLPRSESLTSDFTDSSYDSAETETETEEGIVCLGERIACTYDVGVIGMAI
ncbi:hypothetical protein JCM21900_000459 [Sporobolomyces salmonicolor]